MATQFETLRIEDWLDTVLSAVAASSGATAGAWEGVIPVGEGVGQVGIVYNLQSSVDIDGAAGVRNWTNSLYQVKVTGPATLISTIVATLDAIETALQLVGDFTIGPAHDVVLMRVKREMTIPFPVEIVSGVKQVTKGALWRIFAN